jgi:hypothetical protein
MASGDNTGSGSVADDWAIAWDEKRQTSTLISEALRVRRGNDFIDDYPDDFRLRKKGFAGHIEAQGTVVILQ